MAELIAIVVLLIILTNGISLICDGYDNNKLWLFAIGIIVSVSSIFIAGLVYQAITNKNIPQAIDVYRGKTTLQITYQDSIPVDSVVVFKE